MARRWRRKRGGKGKPGQEKTAAKEKGSKGDLRKDQMRPLEMLKGSRQAAPRDRAEKGGQWLDELVDEVALSLDAEVKRIVHTDESQAKRWDSVAKDLKIPKGE